MSASSSVAPSSAARRCIRAMYSARTSRGSRAGARQVFCTPFGGSTFGASFEVSGSAVSGSAVPGARTRRKVLRTPSSAVATSPCCAVFASTATQFAAGRDGRDGLSIASRGPPIASMHGLHDVTTEWCVPRTIASAAEVTLRRPRGSGANAATTPRKRRTRRARAAFSCAVSGGLEDFAVVASFGTSELPIARPPVPRNTSRSAKAARGIGVRATANAERICLFCVVSQAL